MYSDHFSDAFEYLLNCELKLKAAREKRNNHPAILKKGYRLITRPDPKWPKPLEFALEMEDAVIEAWEEGGVHYSIDFGHQFQNEQ